MRDHKHNKTPAEHMSMAQRGNIHDVQSEKAGRRRITVSSLFSCPKMLCLCTRWMANNASPMILPRPSGKSARGSALASSGQPA